MSFTRINNAFLDNLHKFTSTETKILLAIARHTIGSGKKIAKISLQNLHEQTGCAIDSIQRSIKTLVPAERDVLKVEKEAKSQTYELLKGSGLIFDPTATNILAIENAFTPIDNAFIDNLHKLTSPQVKIMLTIARHTIGASIQSAQISMPLFKDNATS